MLFITGLMQRRIEVRAIIKVGLSALRGPNTVVLNGSVADARSVTDPMIIVASKIPATASLLLSSVLKAFGILHSTFRVEKADKKVTSNEKYRYLPNDSAEYQFAIKGRLRSPSVCEIAEATNINFMFLKKFFICLGRRLARRALSPFGGNHCRLGRDALVC